MILIAIDDLMLRSRVTAASKQLGVAVQYAGSADDLLRQARSGRPSLIILDLNATRTDPIRTIASMKRDAELASIRLLGFVSHVDTATIQAARLAGIDEVLARGAFVDTLPQILAEG
jgi:DNA-binding response OmpR family regulator